MSTRTRKEARKKARRAAAAAEEAAATSVESSVRDEVDDLTQKSNNSESPLEEKLQSLTLQESSPPLLPPVSYPCVLQTVCIKTTPKISLNAYTTVVIRSALMKNHSTATIGGGRVTLEVVGGLGGGSVGVKTAIKLCDDESLSLEGGGNNKTARKELDRVVQWRLDEVRKILPSSMMIHGLPGSGKTHLLSACESLFPDRRVVRCRGSDFVSQVVGEGERRVREVFGGENKLILIDDVGVVAANRKNNEWGSICSEILSAIDGYESEDAVEGASRADKRNIVIGTCVSLKDLDPAMTRAGRLSGLVECKWGDAERWECLVAVLKEYGITVEGMEKEEYREHIRRGVAGWVGADVVGTVKMVKREEVDLEERGGVIEGDRFMSYVKDTSPTTMRSETVEVEKISWDDIGGMSGVKTKIRRMVTGRVEVRREEEVYLSSTTGRILTHSSHRRIAPCMRSTESERRGVFLCMARLDVPRR